jgi:2-iminobutanoate/2-iminopropanoate deaminase
MRAGDWIICAGQIGVSPETGALVEGGVVAEGRQALVNLAAILADVECGWEHVARINLYFSGDMTELHLFNEFYPKVLGEHRPPRSAMGVTWLPRGASIEIEAWAYKPR